MQRPDPPSTKKLCIITLTRIFLLTHEDQTLVREITTPSLPGFITACLNLTEAPISTKTSQGPRVQGSLLFVVLQSLTELIALHPTLFRPFVEKKKLQNLLFPLIAPTLSNFEPKDSIEAILGPVSKEARHLFVLLHVCFPKNTAGEEWARQLHTISVSTHRTADRVFRALIEDWRPSTEKLDLEHSMPESEVVCDQKPEPLALPSWTGIYAGVERLDGLLHTVQAFLASSTSTSVVLPVSTIMALIDRVLSVFPPSKGKGTQIRPEIGRDEREGLWAGLPRLHVSAMEVLSLMITRLGVSFGAMAHGVLEQSFWVLESEGCHTNVRRTAYQIISKIFEVFGPSLPKPCAISLSRCVKMCCEDLLTQNETPKQDGGPPNSKKFFTRAASSSNANSYLQFSDTGNTELRIPADVLAAARKLLPLTLTSLPNGFLSFSLRCLIDRTAILSNNKEAMLGSVMNPAEKQKGGNRSGSILPMLVRAYPEACEVEALLRPQMPILRSKRRDEEQDMSEEEDETYRYDDKREAIQADLNRHAFDLDETGNIQEGIVGSKVQVSEAIQDLGGFEYSKATLELPELAHPTVIGLPDPEFAIAHTSNKRDLTDIYEHDTNLGAPNASAIGTLQPSVIDSPSKRPRLDLDKTKEEAQEEAQEDHERAPRNYSPAVAAPTKPIIGSHFEVAQDDSNESDFEMPTLYLEPDTDQEGEEDEDNE